MGTNALTVFATLFNLVIIIAIVVVIIKMIRGFRKFSYRNKAMDEKLDHILNKLEDKL